MLAGITWPSFSPRARAALPSIGIWHKDLEAMGRVHSSGLFPRSPFFLPPPPVSLPFMCSGL